jgi:hypothetical protein
LAHRSRFKWLPAITARASSTSPSVARKDQREWFFMWRTNINSRRDQPRGAVPASRRRCRWRGE